MHLVDYLRGRTVIHRLDPRSRVLAALVWTPVLATIRNPWAALAGVGCGLALVRLAGLDMSSLLKRLGQLNLFMLLMVVILPWSTPGRALFQLGPHPFTAEGLSLALTIALKGNGIVLALTALISTIEPVSLGHALHHLRAPDKLTHLFLFTIRYLDVLHHEYHRLRRAMKARCFKAGLNRLTFIALGNLAASLLVRSLDRSDRVAAAMKCRGFKGKFYVLSHFHFHRRDGAFGLVAVIGAAGLAWWGRL